MRLILWINELQHIGQIAKHLLASICAFALICQILTCVKSFLVYNMKHPKQLTLLDYKTVIVKNLIRWHQSRQTAVPLSRPSKSKSTSVARNGHGGHLPEFRPTRKRCTYCSKEGKENGTFVACLACDIPCVQLRIEIAFQSIICKQYFSIVKTLNKDNTVEKNEKTLNYAIYISPPLPNPEGHLCPLICTTTQNYISITNILPQ